VRVCCSSQRVQTIDPHFPCSLPDLAGRIPPVAEVPSNRHLRPPSNKAYAVITIAALVVSRSNGTEVDLLILLARLNAGEIRPCVAGMIRSSCDPFSLYGSSEWRRVMPTKTKKGGVTGLCKGMTSRRLPKSSSVLHEVAMVQYSLINGRHKQS
jgi:hypothetical protein